MDIDQIAKYRILILAGIATIFVSTILLIGYLVVRNIRADNTQKPATISSADGFNGVYQATAKVSDGVANTRVEVTNNAKIAGQAKYVGPNNLEVPIIIEGTVNSSGEVSGTMLGSGVVDGETARAEGSFSGDIKDDKANITYIISTPKMTFKNYTTLTRK